MWKEKSEDIFKKKILEVLGVGTKKHIIDQLSERIRIVTSLEDHKFNQDTLVVNCTNGELHLDNQTGGITMHSHNRESYSTVQLPVNYDPAAIAPRFKKFLDEVFENDPDKEQKKLCIYQMIGYCLIREQRYDTFFM